MSKYSGDKRILERAYLHQMMGQELEEKGKCEVAKQEYFAALKLDPKETRVNSAKKDLIAIIEAKLQTLLSPKQSTVSNEVVKLWNQLGSIYFITGDYKEAEKCYRKTLDIKDVQKRTENDTAKEKLCEIYYQLESYEKCIDHGEINKSSHLREYVAKSHFKIAQEQKHSDFQGSKENLSRSAELGLLDAGMEFLSRTEEECSNNDSLCLTKRIYEEMARLHCWFSHETGPFWSLGNVDISVVCKTIPKNARRLILLQPGISHMAQVHRKKLKKTRKLRFEMTRKKVCLHPSITVLNSYPVIMVVTLLEIYYIRV